MINDFYQLQTKVTSCLSNKELKEAKRFHSEILKLRSNLDKSDIFAQIARYELSVKTRNISKYGPNYLTNKRYLKETEENMNRYKALRNQKKNTEEEKMFGKHHSQDDKKRELTNIKNM